MIKLNTKQIWILGITAGVVLPLGGWIGYRLIAGKPIIPNFHKKRDELEAQLEDLRKQKEAEAQGKSYVPESTEKFPLVIGMKGDKIKAMQTALNNKFAKSVEPVAGYLGTKTETALNEIGYELPLTEADYNNVIAGKKFTQTEAGKTTETETKEQPKTGASVLIAKEDVNIYANKKMEYAIKTIKKGNIVGTYKKTDGIFYIVDFVGTLGLRNQGYVLTSRVKLN